MRTSTHYILSIFFLFFVIASSSSYPKSAKPATKPVKSPKPGKSPKPESFHCDDPGIKCEGIKVTCPQQCPLFKPTDNTAKACYVNCNDKNCEAVCRHRKPNCNGIGSACYDPRFVGGDGIMFYFHGKTNEQFALVSDPNLQINARFIGRRPTGRTRDNTWIQALGLMFDSHSFTLSANRVEQWDDEVDQLALTYDGALVSIPQGHLSVWSSHDGRLKVERTMWANSVTIVLSGVLEMSVRVVPVTKEDDLKHGYQIPSDDCFAHLEVQFKFLHLSEEVEGVLGQTYRQGFKNPVKRGVPMPVMGGEDRFKTSELLSADCKQCIFQGGASQAKTLVLDSDVTVDCSSKMSNGRGFVCRR